MSGPARDEPTSLGAWQGPPPAWRGDRPRLVVLPFAAHDYDGYQIVYARRLAEWLATRLHATGAVDAALPLLIGTGQAGADYARLTRLPEPEAARDVGRQAGADWVVFGRLNLLERCECELFVLDVRTGALVLGEAGEHELERTLEALTALALLVLRASGVSPLADDARSRLFDQGTRSPEALRAALLAADLLAQPDGIAADQANGLAYAFAALGHDPAFRLPADLVLAVVLARLDGSAGVAADGLGLLRRLTLAAPGYHRVAGTVGLVWQRGGDHGQAVQAYREALRLSPDHPHYLFRLGVSLDVLDDEEALPVLTAAVAADPDNVAAQDLLAARLAHIGRLDEARAVWVAQLARDPDHAPALTNLGAAHEAAGAQDQAREAYLAASRASPAYAPAFDRLAALAGRLGEHEREVAALERLAALHPSDASVLDRLARALARVNRPESELAAWRQLSELRPDYWPAHFASAARLQALGRRDEAIEAYRQVLALAPDHRPSLVELGVLLGGKRRLTEAATYLGQAYALEPADPAAAYNFAIVQMERGDWVQAETLLGQVKALAPDDPLPDRALIEIARRRARGF